MRFSIAEKIEILAKRRNMTIKELAEKTGQSRQNLNGKLSRDNFSINELEKIAAALNCQFDGIFTLNDTKEKL